MYFSIIFVSLLTLHLFKFIEMITMPHLNKVAGKIQKLNNNLI